MAARTGYRHWNKSRATWSERQRDVLDLLAKGYTNGQIAERLGITLDGAKWHVSELIAELNARSRDEVAEYWRNERSPMNRLAHALLPLVAIKPVAMGAAAVAGAAAIAVGAVVIAAGGGGNNALLASDASPTPSEDHSTPPPTVTAGGTPVPPPFVAPADADPQLLQYIESAGIPLDLVTWYGQVITLEGYEVTLEAGYADEFRTVFFVHAEPVDAVAAETLPWVHITTAYLVDGEGREIEVKQELGRTSSGGPLDSRTRFSFEALSSSDAGEGLAIRFNELMGPDQQYVWANWAFEVDLPVQPDAVVVLPWPTAPTQVGEVEFAITSLVRSGNLLHLEWRIEGAPFEALDWRPGEGPPPMPLWLTPPVVLDSSGEVLPGAGAAGMAGGSQQGVTEGQRGFAVTEPGTYTVVFGDPAAPEVEFWFEIP
jgi:DNA-binding CsgD family transcriptional regulator